MNTNDTAPTDSTNKECVVTAYDGHFAVPDAVARVLSSAHFRLDISAPWITKGFVDLMRKTVSTGIEINVITRTPKENNDSIVYVINALQEASVQHNWHLKVSCLSRLHPKIIIADNKICFTGSANTTDSGLYYNIELGFILTQPYVVERINNFFSEMNQTSVSWQNMLHYHGFEELDQRSVLQKIAEKYIVVFEKNGNQPLRKFTVFNILKSQGFEERDIISVERYLLNKGTLYEPKIDWIRLTITQTTL